MPSFITKGGNTFLHKNRKNHHQIQNKYFLISFWLVVPAVCRVEGEERRKGEEAWRTGSLQPPWIPSCGSRASWPPSGSSRCSAPSASMPLRLPITVLPFRFFIRHRNTLRGKNCLDWTVPLAPALCWISIHHLRDRMFLSGPVKLLIRAISVGFMWPA